MDTPSSKITRSGRIQEICPLPLDHYSINHPKVELAHVLQCGSDGVPPTLTYTLYHTNKSVVTKRILIIELPLKNKLELQLWNLVIPLRFQIFIKTTVGISLLVWVNNKQSDATETFHRLKGRIPYTYAKSNIWW